MFADDEVDGGLAVGESPSAERLTIGEYIDILGAGLGGVGSSHRRSYEPASSFALHIQRNIVLCCDVRMCCIAGVSWLHWCALDLVRSNVTERTWRGCGGRTRP